MSNLVWDDHEGMFCYKTHKIEISDDFLQKINSLVESLNAEMGYKNLTIEDVLMNAFDICNRQILWNQLDIIQRERWHNENGLTKKDVEEWDKKSKTESEGE